VQLTAESRWPCREDRKAMSSVLSLELEELRRNYNRSNPAGLSYKTELQSALGETGFNMGI